MVTDTYVTSVTTYLSKVTLRNIMHMTLLHYVTKLKELTLSAVS